MTIWDHLNVGDAPAEAKAALNRICSTHEHYYTGKLPDTQWAPLRFEDAVNIIRGDIRILRCC